MGYIAVNKIAWDKRTKIHVESDCYDLPTFLADKSSLNPIELTLLGDVRAKSLLLQFHFGQDTLSWARLGATVTGVYLSGEAIAKAQSLAGQLSIDAVFIEDDVTSFGQSNQQQFDIVFSSYGTLNWLRDLNLWAQKVGHSLKTSGCVNLVESHPISDFIAGDAYFESGKADVGEAGTNTEIFKQKSWYW
ncbi:MAG: methyltransferase domain-containing protein [Pseudomonadales bacterium]|nr:methyltransferase domain-containing protein [Pseudomonadales bacterium]